MGHCLVLGLIIAASEALPSTFSYSYTDPSFGNSRTYIHSTSNVRQEEDFRGTTKWWQPDIGGATFETTTPGVITYKFDFATSNPGQVLTSADLFTKLTAYNQAYSVGQTQLSASRDGLVWESLAQALPPSTRGGVTDGSFNGALPTSVLGGTELWLRMDLYSYGIQADRGGPNTNTAQHSRWTRGEGNSFSLTANLGTPGGPGSATSPFLPDEISADGGFVFKLDPEDIVEGETFYIDPDSAIGYDYAVEQAEFSSVTAPTFEQVADGDGEYLLSFSGGSQSLAAGDTYDFGEPVSMFSITGIDPTLMLDPTDPTAFITGVSLAGVTGEVTITQTPIVDPAPIPVPWTGALLLAGLGALVGRKKLAPRS